MMTAEKVLRDRKLMTILDRYSDTEEQDGETVSQTLGKLFEGLSNPEMIIPVLGSQGVGKSTLINAILGDNILPSDSDETTCVPVEIRYGMHPCAVVYFQSGKTQTIDVNCDALREYVDNNQNSGNEKLVSRIALEAPVPLLKNGIVLVDLPGVGSLTEQNQETTMRYIKRLCTAIFVVPTTPTIRRTEEIFIRGAWSSFSSAIFIQNLWDGDSQEDAEDAAQFNSLVLNKIAEKAHLTFDRSSSYFIVNAYQGIFSKLHGDTDGFLNSGVPKLTKALDTLAQNRVDMEKEAFIARLRGYLDAALAVLKQYRKEATMNEEQRHAEHQQHTEEFAKSTKELTDQIDELKHYIENTTEDIKVFLKNIVKVAEENLRADMFRLIDNGVVDGSQLTDAFNDNQEKYANDVIEQYYDYTDKIKYELGMRLDALAERMSSEQHDSYEGARFYKKSAFKFEKILKFGVDIAGGIGGIAAGSWIGGIVSGAIAGSWGGPVGIAVGLLVGLGVSVAASLLGKKGEKAITDVRGTKTKRQLDPYFRDFEKNLLQTLEQSTADLFKQISDGFDSYIEERMMYYKKLMDEADLASDQTFASMYQTEKLEEDEAYLTKIREALQ